MDLNNLSKYELIEIIEDQNIRIEKLEYFLKDIIKTIKEYGYYE